MYNRFKAMCGILLTTGTLLTTPVFAADTSSVAQGDRDVCKQFATEVETTYIEGQNYLTAEVVAINEREETVGVKATVIWTLPTGEKGQAEFDSSNRSKIVLPVTGAGEYTFTGKAMLAGCDTSTVIDGSITFMEQTTKTDVDYRSQICAEPGSTIYGNSSNNVLHGAANNDVIYGKMGKDILYGYGCDDVLDGGSGFFWPSDFCYGGPGVDTFIRCEVVYQN